jgi:pentapeptide repeat protein
MPKDYSNRNLQKASFKNADLANSNFANSDLRGTDFTGADLTGADFTHVKTGIAPIHTILLFFAALIVSLISGYVAMLAGHLIQRMLISKDILIKIAGIISILLTILFIVYIYLKGGRNAIRNLIKPASFIALLIGFVSLMTGAGTGIGMAALVLVNILVVIMFIVGTVARVVAGALSNILFLIVAMGGGMFGKSVGGGIGTLIMAMSCAIISKRALSGAEGFDALRRIVFSIVSKFGTSFRNARLFNANFSGSIIRDTDFSNTDLSIVNWGDSRIINYLADEQMISEKKGPHKQEIN